MERALREIAYESENRDSKLAYIEQSAESATLTLFLHGLGLDAYDYREYLSAHPDQHAIAITLPGFSRHPNANLPAYGLSTHAQVISEFLGEISRRHTGKKITLVGFSLGADLILRLGELWQQDAAQATPLAAALLLDPNVNHSTMSISALFARADPDNPLPAFKELIDRAADRYWFEALCVYLAKVTAKDFKQLQRLSIDMLGYWNKTGYDQIGSRLAKVAEHASQVRTVLSAPYREHLEPMRAAVESRGAHTVSFKLTGLEHFDLIGDAILTQEIHHLQLLSSNLCSGPVLLRG